MIMEDDKEDDDGAEFDVPNQELNVGEDSATDEPSSEESVPVAAQVEVLYTIDETFTRPKLPTEGDSTEGEKEEGQDVSQTTVAVGVFEGWLNGDPSGAKELRWRLSMNRPAWEFRLLD